MKIAWVFLLIPICAFANESAVKDYDKIYSQCLDNSGPINNSVVAACSEEASNEAKKELNALYNKFYAKLKSENPEDAEKFELSQKSWLKYRNSHCELAGSYVGSPMYGYCPMQLNIERVMQLRELNGE